MDLPLGTDDNGGIGRPGHLARPLRRRSSSSASDHSSLASTKSSSCDADLSQRTSRLLDEYRAYVGVMDGSTSFASSSPPAAASETLAPPATAGNDGASEAPTRGTDPPEAQTPPSFPSQRLRRPRSWRDQRKRDRRRLRPLRRRDRPRKVHSGNSSEDDHETQHDANADRTAIEEDGHRDSAWSTWYSGKNVALAALAAAACLVLLIGLSASHSRGTHADDGATHLRHQNHVPLSPPRTTQSFHRSDGWSGNMYSEAVDYCAFKNLSLCSYSAICPHGPGSMPNVDASLGRDNDVNGLAWVAYDDVGGSNVGSNDANAWVQVGAKDRCLTYDFIHGRPPSWGLTGEDSEELTRHVVCCPPADEDFGDADEAGASLEGPGGQEGQDSPSKKTPAASNASLEHSWYGPSDGWSGSTLDDARAFCSSRDEAGSSFPCPYEAYCPDGPHRPPQAGGPYHAEEIGGNDRTPQRQQSWAIVLDETGPGYVQIAGANAYGEYDATCKVHLSRDGGGALSGRMTTHVMCCKIPDAEL